MSQRPEYTFNELCTVVGKPGPYVLRLLNQLDLGPVRKNVAYPEGMIFFMEKVVALRAFGVAVERIRDLLALEKKVQILLHADSLASGPYWYFASCAGHEHGPTRLLLTGHDLGFPASGPVVQANLDFREREQELFRGHEMGENIHDVLARYLEHVGRIREQVKAEAPVLRNALTWSALAFHISSGRNPV